MFGIQNLLLFIGIATKKSKLHVSKRILLSKGWDVLYAELLEKTWKEKMDEWSKRPKGERVGVPSLGHRTEWHFRNSI